MSVIGTAAIRFPLEYSEEFLGFRFLITLKFLLFTKELFLHMLRLCAGRVHTGYSTYQCEHEK